MTRIARSCVAAFDLGCRALALTRVPPVRLPGHDRGRAPLPAQRSGTLQAFLVSALALPGMVGVAQASSDDVVSTTTAKVPSLPALDDTAQPDSDQQFAIQYSHYQEGPRTLIHPAATGIIPATPGSNVTGTIFSEVALPSLRGITSDGEHAYARFRIGDRARLSVDYAQDIWSGASPIATLPANMMSGASMSATVSGYFNGKGQPIFPTQYQANANAANPSGPVQKNLYSLDQIGHAMGYASPEARKQPTVRFGYDWSETAVDIGAGVSSEVDFLSQFGNVSLRRDLDDKRTSVNLGASFTRGHTRAERNSDGMQAMPTDAYADTNLFPTSNVAGRMVYLSRGGTSSSINAPLLTGERQDLAITGGVTQVVNRNDLFSTGFGYTHTSGYLGNPYKGAYIFYPAGVTPPEVLAFNPDASLYSGKLELEKRPSLRRQFTWDTSYLHYLEHQNAAIQAHYGLFVDSWGVVGHTVDAEWRQSLGSRWQLTPRVRYYTQKAANFYAPYFFFAPGTDLTRQNFSSDERLSAFGTLNPGITLSRTLSRGLKIELGADFSRRSGSLKLGTGGDAPYADIHSSTLSVALTGSLDGIGANSDGSPSGHEQHLAHQHHGEIPAGVMGGQMMDAPGSVMLGYVGEQDKQGQTYLAGTHAQPVTTGMTITGMTMSMQMLDLMYVQSRWLNWMLMPQIVDMKMGMFANELVSGSMAGMDMPMHSYMASGGLGDTTVAALIRLWEGPGGHLHLTQGLSIPTGSVNVQVEGKSGQYAYDMQPGSGTWDYKPSLTYTGTARDLFWGLQASGTVRLQGRNRAGYALGNEAALTAWTGYRMTRWLDGTLRVLQSGVGALRGQLNSPPLDPNRVGLTTDYDPQNYGGRYSDVGLGLSAALGGGAYAGDRIGLEYLKPVRTNVNGIQNQPVGTVFLRASFMF